MLADPNVRFPLFYHLTLSHVLHIIQGKRHLRKSWNTRRTSRVYAGLSAITRSLADGDRTGVSSDQACRVPSLRMFSQSIVSLCMRHFEESDFNGLKTCYPYLRTLIRLAKSVQREDIRAIPAAAEHLNAPRQGGSILGPRCLLQ